MFQSVSFPLLNAGKTRRGPTRTALMAFTTSARFRRLLKAMKSRQADTKPVSRCFSFPVNIRKKQGLELFQVIARTMNNKGRVAHGAPFYRGAAQRGPHFQRLESSEIGVSFPRIGNSRGWKKKFQSLETWPRRDGIAGRCNAEGRNRRKAKSGCQAYRAPGKGAGTATAQQRRKFRSRRQRGHGGEERLLRVNGRAGPRENPCEYSSSGFRRARLWSETPTTEIG